MSIKKFWRCLVLGALVACAWSCAEERPPLDRVQPNALEKGIFTGEWYYQRTVVDVPASTGFTFVGNTDYSGLTRVRWDVQEDFLYARRTTELIRGADARPEQAEGYEGEVVGAFRIEKHFDIVKAYNPTTGEQLNVLEENSSDRPWYERAYMRVDWSRNAVTNFQLDFERASVEPVAYYVQEIDPLTGQRHPDAPFFEPDGSYFDVTNKLFARAGTVEIEGYGAVPSCWLRGEELSECGSGEYTIRNSFMKVDPSRQYEPMAYKGKETELFGFFWTDRLTYNDRDGIREQNRERYINRHNLWQRSFDAEGGPIPMSERRIRPIVYHVNDEFPEDLKPVAQEVADQWNAVFVDVVKAAGKDPGDQRVFVLCPNNPVRSGDPLECGAVGNSPRIGDLRYSFMAYVPRYMTYGLLGLGPSNSDPETGEIISGMAYVYHHNNVAAYRVQEMVELLNGDRNSQSFIDGVDLSDWVDEVNGRREAASRTFGLEEAGYMTERLSKGWAASAQQSQRVEITAEDERQQAEVGFDRWLAPHLEAAYREGVHNGERSAPEARLAALEGTYVEALLLDEEILMAGGKAPGAPTLPEHVEAASVARGGLGEKLKDRAKMREQFAERHNMYLPEMADDALLGLAREVKDMEPEAVYTLARQKIYTAVLAHEVGHSLGLMHNFGGSDDAINYDEKYWQLRDDGQVGPRLTDPITLDEIYGKIYDYAYSSVMDYAGRYTIDGAGLGKYDRAAMLYGYARKVEVFKDTGGVPAGELRDWFERDGDLLTFTNQGPRTTHYTSFYNRMGSLLYDPDNRALVDVDDLDETYSLTALDGRIAPRVPYIYCSHNRANLGDNCLTRDFGADSYERMKNNLDELDTWYIVRSFPRGVVGVDNYNYVNRTYDRIYDRLKNWNDIYGLYADLLPRFYDEATMQRFLLDAETGWGGQTWAVQNAFNHLVQTVLMPDIGDYGGPFTQADGTRLMQSGVRNANLSLGVTDARFYSTSWGDGDRDCGYQWWECLHHIGFYLDKIMAIEALTDTRTNFVSRATPEDIRQWEIGYFTTFPDQLLRINAAIMGQSWDRVGPYAQNGRLRFPNYAGDLRERNDSPVDPFATFSIQLYWQVLGQARFPRLFDRSFIDESRLFFTGGDAPDLPPERTRTWSDPTSGYTFAALDFPDRITAGEEMIDRAVRLTAWSNFCDEDASTEATEDDCDPNVDQGSRDFVTFALIDYLELMRVVADLTPLMDYGDPLDP